MENCALLCRDMLGFLSTAAGEDLLRDASGGNEELLARLTRLRRRWTAEQASAAIELLELRARAQVKFASAGEMFFTREGLQQSSSERVAAWRAARYPPKAVV